ncbi:CAP domain-containing protein [Allorhizobium sp. BGMRC 0089]|uniref:CAP domain-containing protein n=1 Tax=Allorhizobium sonneratiae TaxID=2934936 RepID=UPI002034598D|nr:CAP domain-containing protein [Allorhizobium sonneratiae]MCM2291469.1 CAP domain-containing protein [Allorhizobium sonneratiae]
MTSSTPLSHPVLARRSILLAGLGLAAGLASCQTPPVEPPVPADLTDETETFLPMVNALRAKYGKPPLVSDANAARAALYQAKRMAEANKMAHVMGFGDSFGERMRQSNVQLPAAENIAMMQKTPQAAMQAWINSKHHLENMLGPYHGLGVAVARIPSRGNTPFWSMDLSGAPHRRQEEPGLMLPTASGVMLRID